MIIALIEDDEAALESLCLLLKGRGLAVSGFVSAEAFFASLPELKPACVVSDVRLPGMSGLDLQRALKAAGRDVPVILITGHGDIGMAVTAMKEGAFDFVEKPYNADDLIAGIEKALVAGEKLQFRESALSQISTSGHALRGVACKKRWITSDKTSAKSKSLSSKPCLRLPRRCWAGSKKPSATMSGRTRRLGAREWRREDEPRHWKKMGHPGSCWLAAALTTRVLIGLGCLIVPADTALKRSRRGICAASRTRRKSAMTSAPPHALQVDEWPRMAMASKK